MPNAGATDWLFVSNTPLISFLNWQNSPQGLWKSFHYSALLILAEIQIVYGVKVLHFVKAFGYHMVLHARDV